MTDDSTPAIALAAPTAAAAEDTNSTSYGWLSPLLTAIASAAVAGAIYYGYMQQMAVNEALAKQLSALQTAQHATPILSSDQVSALQSIPAIADTLNKIPAQLEQQSAQMNEQITALAARIDTLEKSSADAAKSDKHRHAADAKLLQQFLALKLALAHGAPFANALAALSEHPEITEAMTPLADYADEGVATEAALRAELNDLLGNAKPTLSASGPPAHSLVARLNSQFEGMLHITQHASTTSKTEAQLRAHAESQAALTLLIQDVQALPASDAARFADWLEAAQARQKADALVLQMEAALAASSSAP